MRHYITARIRPIIISFGILLGGGLLLGVSLLNSMRGFKNKPTHRSQRIRPEDSAGAADFQRRVAEHKQRLRSARPTPPRSAPSLKTQKEMNWMLTMSDEEFAEMVRQDELLSNVNRITTLLVERNPGHPRVMQEVETFLAQVRKRVASVRHP